MKKIFIAFILLLPSVAFAAVEGGHHYDWSGLLWRVITTIVFVAILYFLLKKPIKNFVTNRSKEIETALENALKASNDAKIQLKEYEDKVSKLEAELEEMKANALAGAEKERAMILADTEKTIEKMKTMALNMIETETIKAKSDLKKELSLLAAQDAEKRLEDALKGEKGKELLEEYIKRIGE